jgi:polysaccharide export outer membrane protein
MRKLLYLLVFVALTSCRLLYPSMMLKTPKGYAYTPLPDTITNLEYKMSVNDLVNFRLFSNDGLRLVDFTNIGDNGNASNALYYANNGVDYVVDVDGTVKLPIVGRVMVNGVTIREVTKMLEEKYAAFYIKPYVLLKVTNRRVIIFPGNPGTAKTIPLLNNNTTLFEALALAGGITEDGKAWEVKLIRGNPDKPQVYLIDLSTISGIKAGSMVLQANDIIYVTPQRRFGQQLLLRITPTLSLLSSILLTIAILKTYNVKL